MTTVVGSGRVVSTVVSVSLRAWFNGAARTLGGRRRAWALVVGMLALLACWLVAGTWYLGHSLPLSAADRALFTTPVASVLFTVPAFATLLTALYSPTRTVLNDVLVVLPVRAADRLAAVRWLSVILGAGLGGIWAAPLALQFLFLNTWPLAVPVLLVCLLITVLGSVVAQLLVTTGERAVNWVSGQHGVVANGLAGMGTALVLVWVYLRALPVGGRVQGEGPLRELGRPLGALAAGEPWRALLGVALIAGGLLTAVGLLTLLDRVPRRLGGRAGRYGLSLTWRTPRSLVGLEAVQWLRYPTNATFLMFLGCVSVAMLVLWRDSLDGDQWLVPSYFLFALVSTIGIGSYGPTRNFHWMYRVAGSPHVWIVPKLLGVLLVWSVLLLAHGAALSLFTGWSVTDGLVLLPAVAVELATGCLVGLLLPVNREQSVSAALSETFGILVILAVYVGLQSLPWTSLTGYLAFHLLVLAALVAAYTLVARRTQHVAEGTLA